MNERRSTNARSAEGKSSRERKAGTRKKSKSYSKFSVVNNPAYKTRNEGFVNSSSGNLTFNKSKRKHSKKRKGVPTYGQFTKQKQTKEVAKSSKNDNHMKSSQAASRHRSVDRSEKAARKKDQHDAKRSFQVDPIIAPSVKILNSLKTSPTDDFRKIVRQTVSSRTDVSPHRANTFDSRCGFSDPATYQPHMQMSNHTSAKGLRSVDSEETKVKQLYNQLQEKSTELNSLLSRLRMIID